MSIARHHAEWLSLLEIDGPFLSMPVLLRAFPQGLYADDPELARELRLAYEEWLDNQGGLQPDPAIHRAWVLWVLRQVLGMPDAVLAGAAGEQDARLDALAVTVAEQHETLRPDFAVLEPEAEEAVGAQDGTAVATLAEGAADQDSAPRARLLLMLVPPGQNLERPLAGRHWKASPATRMMTLLHARGLRLGMVTNGERWMLVDAPRGGTTGFVSWYARLWLDERLTQRAFRSLLGADRFFGLPEAETPEGLLAASAGQQQEVTDQLGYQVRQAVEILVDAIDGADQDGGGTLLAGMAMPELYQAAVTVMMRLVFLFAAEERGLLLLGDPLYDEHYAVSTLAARLREAADLGGEELLGRRHDAWSRLLATFRAVHGGVSHDRLRLPAYGGDLFDPDRFPFLEGRPAGSRWREAPARPLPIDNRTVLHLLEALQLLRVPVPGGGGAELQRLSFRALGIEQIGHVYEGLLDHTAVRAQDVVLGLAGTKAKEPEIPITWLEEAGGKGDEELIRLLKEQTGRSEKALTKALKGYVVNAPTQSRLLEACGNDTGMLYRITPYAGLIREDSYGTPYVVKPRSAYVTTGTDRRATGAHYTPRSLTEPIVQRTLEPVVYRGPAEGLPREAWRLKGAAELLDLKVCDMAMGSGAFLVQACRYLGERLMEAWEGAERGVGRGGDAGAGSPAIIDITPEGAPAGEGDPVVPRDPVDREMTALRLVASRCLYGVDKNPLAVEMAKLSLWLLTLAKGQRFTFLDHALKCGDSLVGLSRIQIERFSWDPPEQAGQMLLASGFIAERLKQAEELRRWVREAGPEVREEQLKQQNQAAERALEDVRLIGDVVIAAFFDGDKPKVREGKRLAAWERVRGWLGGEGNAGEAHAELLERTATLRAGAKGVAPFHWEVEFPEVFGRAGAGDRSEAGVGSGFDGIVGNPPFLGGRNLSATAGEQYSKCLLELYSGSGGGADLVAHFFRRAYSLMAPGGCFGLIATNTIAQGDTRASGLAVIRRSGASLFAANRRVPWPGQAAVIVSVVHARRGSYRGVCQLDDQPVERITAFLFPTGSDDDPHRLTANAGKSFQGSIILGMGFTFDDTDKKGKASPIAEMRRLIAANPSNQEVISPYIGGEEINTSPTHAHHRFVINFGERGEAECRERWPELMGIVEAKVKPDRIDKDAVKYPRMVHEWWKFWNGRPELTAAIRGRGRVLVIARVGQYASFAFVTSGTVCSEQLVVIANQTNSAFATLQSRPHEIWARFFGSSMKDDLRYTPSDCFETFPFPPAWETDPALEAAGEAYYSYRAQLMVANDEGLTKTYNRFHDPDEPSPQIHRLRELHAALDRAVLNAYGWGDVPTDCQFLLDYEVTEEAAGRKKPWRYRWPDAVRDDVLGRLLALNQARYEEEVAMGLHSGAGGKTGGRAGVGRKGKGAGAGAAEDEGAGVQGRLL